MAAYQSIGRWLYDACLCLAVDILRIGTVAIVMMWTVEKKIDRERVPILWISSGSWN